MPRPQRRNGGPHAPEATGPVSAPQPPPYPLHALRRYRTPLAGAPPAADPGAPTGGPSNGEPESATPAPGPPPLRRNRPYWLFWTGETISVLGTSITAMLISLLAVVVLHASPIWVGVINAATWAPWVLIGLPIGAWVDQRSPRAVMVAADVGAALALLSVPAAWLTGRLAVEWLAVVSFAVGTSTVFFRAAYPKLVATLVRREDLAPANSYLTGSESVAQVSGPPLGGVLAAVFAPAVAVLIDAASYVVSALFLLRLPRQPRPRMDAPRESLRARIAVGWRFNFADPFLRYFTLQGALSNTGLTGFQALLVLVLVRELHLTGPQAGLAVGVQGVGTLLGAMAAPPLGRRLGQARAIVALFCGVGLGGLLLPWGAPGWRVVLMLAGMFLIGFCVVCANVIRGAWRQAYVPMSLMARTNTAAQTVNFSLMPLAAVAAGGAAELLGLVPAVAIMGGIVAVVSFSVLFSPLRGHRDLPGQPSLELLALAKVAPPAWEDTR